MWPEVQQGLGVLAQAGKWVQVTQGFGGSQVEVHSELAVARLGWEMLWVLGVLGLPETQGLTEQGADSELVAILGLAGKGARQLGTYQGTCSQARSWLVIIAPTHAGYMLTSRTWKHCLCLKHVR